MEIRKLKGTKYSVRSNGDIIYTKTNRILTPFSLHKSLYVDIRINKKKVRMLVRNLVALAFFPVNEDEEGEVLYLTNDRSNHSIKNLQWVSKESNDTCYDPAIDLPIIIKVAQDNSLLGIYSGIKHTAYKTDLTEFEVNHYLNTDNAKYGCYYYSLEYIEIVAVASEYMVFKCNNKFHIISYDQTKLETVVKFLRNVSKDN